MKSPQQTDAVQTPNPSDAGPIDAALRRWTRTIDRLKARLTLRSASASPKLEAALDEAVTTYDLLLQDLAGAEIANRHLRSEVASMERQLDDFFQKMPVACVVTDASGTIRRVNARAASLLNTSARHLERESGPLVYYVQERQPFFALLNVLATGGENVGAALLIRPRERAPMQVDTSVVPHNVDGESLLLWFLNPGSVPCGDSRTTTSAD